MTEFFRSGFRRELASTSCDTVREATILPHHLVAFSMPSQAAAHTRSCDSSRSKQSRAPLRCSCKQHLCDTLNSQEFAWPEEDLPKRKADRGSSLKADMAAELAKEPMFCLEARF